MTAHRSLLTVHGYTGQYLRDLLPGVGLEGPRGERVVTAGAQGELEPASRADDN